MSALGLALADTGMARVERMSARESEQLAFWEAEDPADWAATTDGIMTNLVGNLDPYSVF